MFRMLLTCALAGAANLAAAQEGPAPSQKPVQLAQACGWYAIMHCGSAETARGYRSRTGAGFIINTSRGDYPNFQPGYFCVVQGPAPRSEALIIAQQWRNSGFSPSAYAKSAC